MMKYKLIKLLSLLTLSVIFIQCNIPVLDPDINNKVKYSYKYSVYNPDLSAHVINSYYTAYPVPITSEYLFSKDYIWLGTISGTRYLYQFRSIYGEPIVYASYASSILKYERWQIYEDRQFVPTVIYTNSSGDWFMSFSPIFYQYKDEYAMNTNFNYNKKASMIFTNIKPALKPIALSTELSKVATNNFGNLIPQNINEQDVQNRLINTVWYSMETNYKRRATSAIDPSYQFLANRELKTVTGNNDPTTSTNAISKGWSTWQVPIGEGISTYLNYIYVYDIRIMRIFLNYPAGTDFSTITVNTNLDVLMLWYNPSTIGSGSPPEGPFTRYTVDKE